MNKYQKITEARKLLELPERATMQGIKSNYRKLIKKWHPDKSSDNIDTCHEMTKEVIAAYKTIMSYCNHYKFSFAKEEVKKYLSVEEWWFDRFGNDPLWTSDKKPK